MKLRCVYHLWSHYVRIAWHNRRSVLFRSSSEICKHWGFTFFLLKIFQKRWFLFEKRRLLFKSDICLFTSFFFFNYILSIYRKREIQSWTIRQDVVLFQHLMLIEYENMNFIIFQIVMLVYGQERKIQYNFIPWLIFLKFIIQQNTTLLIDCLKCLVIQFTNFV